MPSTGDAEATSRSGSARSRHLRPLAIAKLVHDKISTVPSVIHVPLSAEVSERNWTAFLKRDLGSGFGILDRLAIIQAAIFFYDQILNDSMLETAAMYAISHQWQMLRSR
jgi:hypothetical protein